MVVTATDKATVGAMPENRRAGRGNNLFPEQLNPDSYIISILIK